MADSFPALGAIRCLPWRGNAAVSPRNSHQLPGHNTQGRGDGPGRNPEWAGRQPGGSCCPTPGSPCEVTRLGRPVSGSGLAGIREVEGMTVSDGASVLLHVCCAPCGAYAVEVLRQRFAVTLFFSNANISPEEEHRRRLTDVRRLGEICGCALVEDDYDHAAWQEAVAGLELEPERGKRCLRCFEFNLGRTAARAEALGCTAFCTTLTISPHKVSKALLEVGSRFPGFLPIDFKKNDGYRQSVNLSRKYGFYRQSYCGCEFSVRSGTSTVSNSQV